MNEAKNAICAPLGFLACAVEAGIRKNRRLDLGLIYSQAPAVACGMFTQNSFAAAPVVISKSHLETKKAQAIIVNSGNANCYTGKKGLATARKTAALIANLLRLRNSSVLVASTGVIGRDLDFQKIKLAAPGLIKGLSKANGSRVALAIMTTDTHPKELRTRINLCGKAVTIGAVAKGAGMIQPDMATMLCFITTDCAIQYPALKAALKEAVVNSFNMITVDGCMSTNDSVLILANGLAANRPIALKSNDFHKFTIALKEICLGLARMIVRDAEGASKFITVRVSGGRNNNEARKAAFQIANSNLFKTALYGENPNWGRIIAAVGQSAVRVRDNLGIKFTSLKKTDIVVDVDLRVGRGKSVVYTSDLTPEYVRINAEYN